MDDFTRTALTESIMTNYSENARILDFIKEHPSEEGELARQAYKRTNIITLLIIFIVMIPLASYAIISFLNSVDNPVYPNGATKQVNGHISLYEETFWYTEDNKKYEYSFEDYHIDDSYEPGENIDIYLDDDNNIISVAHQKGENKALVRFILALGIPIILLLLHAFMSRKMYSRWWYLYGKWYHKEIEPYIYQSDFEEIIADKKFYDVTVNNK